MKRIIFLLEEFSMKVLLDNLLPRLVPNLPFLCIPHEGKQDLEKSIPRKLRAWNEPGAVFVIVRDNDVGDCRVLKQKLLALCSSRDDVFIRIACQALESWYFGQPEVLSAVYRRPDLQNLSAKKKYRIPDSIVQPAEKLKTLIPKFQKVSGARLMGEALSFEESRSHSFNLFIASIRKIAEQFNNLNYENDQLATSANLA